MKKRLLILFALAFPLTSMAQETPKTQMTVGTTLGSLERFFPIFCHGNMQQAIDAIKSCYQEIPATNPDIEYCLIADIYVTHMAKHLNQTAISSKEQPKYDVNFINGLDQRLTTYLNTSPLYKDYNSETYKTYMENSYLVFKISLITRFAYKFYPKDICPKSDFNP
ncbi:unnamed protein product [Commensalibacter communis]|uniref:hypothetical protein n=1 Tax=Commensalibacter communis TaxID=2972786 RepID=UPI0022FF804F|nr:hypothetical protein [Commensalibacter communis]CAI3958471.1 unnamed protein product [Commensalibacter communis]